MMNVTGQVARLQWWVLLARGVLAILFGIIALAAPGIALLAFIYVFAAYALLDGIIAVVVSLQERSSLRTWWVLLLEGILGILFGILAFAWPGETALVLLFLVAIWALVTGVMEVSSAFVVPGSAGQRWGLGLAGLLSILFGLVLFVHPGAGLLAILWLVGIYAIVFGVSLIVYAFQVRSRIRTLAPARGTE